MRVVLKVTVNPPTCVTSSVTSIAGLSLDVVARGLFDSGKGRILAVRFARGDMEPSLFGA